MYFFHMRDCIRHFLGIVCLGVDFAFGMAWVDMMREQDTDRRISGLNISTKKKFDFGEK